MNVTVFGRTGVVGRALVPLLGEHELTAVSRTARNEPGPRWLVADAASGDGVARKPSKVRTSPTTSSTALGARAFEEQDRAAAEMVAARPRTQACAQIVYLGGLGADDPGHRRTCAAAARPERGSPPRASR